MNAENFPMPCSEKPRRLIVFTRYPEAGTSKTRLIPELGAQGAADMQRKMTERVTQTARTAARQASFSVLVCHAGGSEKVFQDWLGVDLLYEAQKGHDLGERLQTSFDNAFSEGCESVVIIGSDIPALSEIHMLQAFKALRSHDVVLGPTLDGGYYLIGANQSFPELFQGMAWGSGEVLSKTLEKTRASGLSVALLEPLADVDRPEDLVGIEDSLKGAFTQNRCPSVSVVIPTLNEAVAISATVTSALREPSVEVIVADGGSNDETRATASHSGAVVVSSPAGRGKQMNAGAAVASAETLLFLHADTAMPNGFSKLIQEALARPRVVGGAFRFSLDEHSLALTVLEWLTNMRSRLFRAPYGDQALFMRTSTFHDLGGYEEVPILEDVIMVQRLKEIGRLALLPDSVVTSARRWKRHGILRTTLLHRAIMLAYMVGVNPRIISKWLRRHGY